MRCERPHRIEGVRAAASGVMRRVFVLPMLGFWLLAASPAWPADPTPRPSGAASGAQSQIPRFSSLNDVERRALEAMLTDEVQRAVDRMERIEGQQPAVTVGARVDAVKSMVVLDFSRGFLPRENGSAWENMTQEIDNLVYALIGETFRFSGTRFLIEGRGILDYHPDEIPVFPQRAARPR